MEVHVVIPCLVAPQRSPFFNPFIVKAWESTCGVCGKGETSGPWVVEAP